MDINLNLNATKQAPTLDSTLLYDVIVIGGGPAGLNAALYAKRKGVDVGIIAGQLGGQIMNTSVVENYLGFTTKSGEELVAEFVNHVNDLDIPTLEYVNVESILPSTNYHELLLSDGQSVKSRTVILATGSNSRKLNVPGEDKLAGRGVAYCAICDAPLFKGKDVIISGGGNSAVEAAIDLSKVAHSVTIVHRSQFRADDIAIKQMMSKENITIHLETQILEILGDEFMTGVRALDKNKNEEIMINSDGIFIEIGSIPNTEPFKDLVKLNSLKQVIIDDKKRTNIPGIFAAGDMTTVPYQQIIIATADGAIAALAANDYLNTLI